MTEARRLHPASPLFNIAKHVRTLIVPGIAVLLFGGDSWQVWVMVLFVPSVVIEVVRFFAFRYRLTDEQMVTTLAFIGRKERTIRYERVQNIESEQGPLHRLLGVAEVRVETGAGGEPEAVLRVVPASEIERIRERVFADRRRAAEPGAAPQELEPVELLRLGPLDHLRLGLTTMRGFVLLAVALGLAWEFKLFERLGDVRGWVMGRVRIESDLQAGLAAGGLLLLVACALAAASIAWAVLRFHGFRLTRIGDDFRLEAGLLTRVAATVPRRRIQLVRLTETLLQRRFSRVSVGVETAGGVNPDSGEESSFGRRWFAPLVAPERAEEIAHEIRPSLSLQAEGWERLSAAARRRSLRKGLAGGLLVGVALGAGAAGLAGPWWGLLGVASGALVTLLTVRGAALVRYRRTEEWIGCRTGISTRQTSVALLDRVQVIEVAESPFDRRWGMATLRIDTAGGGPVGHRVDLAMLDAEETREHALAAARAAERAGFVW